MEFLQWATKGNAIGQYSKHRHRLLMLSCCSLTCVMSSLHGPMVVTHRIQVVKVVLGITSHTIRPPPWWPVGGETPAALTPLHHVGCHVHAGEWELHHVLHLHSSIPILHVYSLTACSHKGKLRHETSHSIIFEMNLHLRDCTHQYLSEAFQVKYEYVWQCPQTQLDAALLELLTVRTTPCIVRSELKSNKNNLLKGQICSSFFF